MTLLLLLSPFYKVGGVKAWALHLFTRFEGLVGGGAPERDEPSRES